ncbi:MAG: efflux RND transporter permease subunit [Myxococcota bacterium]
MIGLVANPRVLATLVGLVVVAGLGAASTIVRQEDPSITNGVALIITPFPGASAERVESLVTQKLEDELETIREIQNLSSTSLAEVSVVTVEIDETILGDERTAPVFAKVRDAISDARGKFPPGVLEPVFDDERFGSYSMIYGLRCKPTAESSFPQTSDVELGWTKRYAEALESKLRGIFGTDHVSVFGTFGEHVEVQLDPERLSAAGLDEAAVARRLSAADAKGAAGVLRAGGNNILLELPTFESLDDIRDVPLGLGGQGEALVLRDVASVRLRLENPPREMVKVDGVPGYLIATQMAAGQRYDLWGPEVHEAAERFRAQLPDGMELIQVFDQTEYTEARLQDLLGNLFTGLGLVVVVLFFTLGLRSALIVTIAIPLVALNAIAVLRLLGVPIHQMSVTGLIVALGLLVDNAIVVTDAVQFRRSEGMRGFAAVRYVVRTLWVPLLASTLTTVLAFVPILILPGRTGEFVGTIGLSVIVALVSSYVMALFVVAPIAGRFSKPRELRSTTWNRAFGATLDWSVRHPFLSMAMATGLSVTGFALSGSLTNQFFPPADRDQFYVELYMPASTSIQATEAAAAKVEDILREEAGVEGTYWTLGRSAPPFYYNMVQNQDGNAAFAQALVLLDEPGGLDRLFPRLRDQLSRRVPEAQVILRELLQGPPVPAPVEYRIYGPDTRVLRELGDELRLRMMESEYLLETTASLTASSPKLRLDLDRRTALAAGLSPSAIAAGLQLRLEGTVGGSILQGPKDLPVRVRTEDVLRKDLTRLQSLPVGCGDCLAPLSALTQASLRPVLDGIPRRNGERVNIVRGFTNAGVFPETALESLEAVLAAHPMEVPPGYRLEMGGDAEQRDDASGDLAASIPVLVLLMVAAVALSLNSFRLAAVIFIVAFQAVGYGLLSLVILRLPLGFNSTIGLIGLVGVAINAGIVISSALLADPRARSGERSRISHVVLNETSRHIISTTITTFGGFVPLLLSSGGFWPPFAASIAGGVVFSAVGSFYFVPAAFLVLTRARNFAPASRASERDAYGETE